jgi:cell division ATPase FtsA
MFWLDPTDDSAGYDDSGDRDTPAKGEGEDTDDEGKEKPEKMYTRSQMEKIIQDNIKRVEKKYQGELSEAGELKKIKDSLVKYGYKGDAKEIAAAIESMVEEKTLNDDLEGLKAQLDDAEMDGASKAAITAVMKKISKLEMKIEKNQGEKDEALKKLEEKQKKQDAFDAELKKQDEELQEKHPGVTIDKLLKNPRFAKFEKNANPRLTYLEVYEAYMDFASDSEKEAIEKLTDKQQRSTSSGKDKGDMDSTWGLTRDQMDLVDDFRRKNPGTKLTYKSYAEKLKKQ